MEGRDAFVGAGHRTKKLSALRMISDKRECRTYEKIFAGSQDCSAVIYERNSHQKGGEFEVYCTKDSCKRQRVVNGR